MRYAFLCFLLFFIGCTQVKTTPDLPVFPQDRFIGKIKLPAVQIRLLVLKHCPDKIANTDSEEAIAAANLAATRGLSIKDIGNFHINKEGETDSALVWTKFCFGDDLKGLKAFISEQMKIGAVPGDTLIIYTIGHGGEDGVMRLGPRGPIVKIIAEAAEENNQETFWWQLSCHAGAGLPDIGALTPRQQELFAMSASSPGDELSYFCTQGDQMEKVFLAIADGSIDLDRDDIVTAGELKAFMTKNYGKKRGNLIFARDPTEPIFGRLQNRIKIVDPRIPSKVFPFDFVPVL